MEEIKKELYTPIVSVVMSVFNAEKYLEASITSILDQSFNDFEFIIINDGSTDNSLEIVKSFNDFRIKIIDRKNKGLIYSLNEGISLAKGNFIARMDADDISLNTRFEEQVHFLNENLDIGIVGSFASIIDGDIFTEKVFKHPIIDADMKAKMFMDSPFIHPSVMFRKELVEKVGGYPVGFHRIEDYALWVKLSKECRFANIPKVLLQYRVLESSETRLGQKDGLVRHNALKSVYSLLFRECNIVLTTTEMESYAYSMLRVHFNLIDYKELYKAYTNVINLSESKDIKKYLVNRLFVRWNGSVLLSNRKWKYFFTAFLKFNIYLFFVKLIKN